MSLTKTQRSLKAWSRQKWRTKSGKNSSITGERYQPSAAIRSLPAAEYAATSAAKAALDTVFACENGTPSGDCFSAAVYSDGAYDVPEGIMCGFPLMTTPDGEIEIIRDFTLSDNARSRLNISVNELLTEKEAVKDLL